MSPITSDSFFMLFLRIVPLGVYWIYKRHRTAIRHPDRVGQYHLSPAKLCVKQIQIAKFGERIEPVLKVQHKYAPSRPYRRAFACCNLRKISVKRAISLAQLHGASRDHIAPQKNCRNRQLARRPMK